MNLEYMSKGMQLLLAGIIVVGAIAFTIALILES